MNQETREAGEETGTGEDEPLFVILPSGTKTEIKQLDLFPANGTFSPISFFFLETL